MCLAQGPQRSDAGEARARGFFGLESSTLHVPLSHWAPYQNLGLLQEKRYKMLIIILGLYNLFPPPYHLNY